MRVTGLDSSVGVATCYGLDCSGIELRCGAYIFLSPPDLPWGPPSLLYNGYRVSLPGVKRSGRDFNHPPPSSAEVREVEVYLCSPSVLSWHVRGSTLPYLYLTLPYACHTPHPSHSIPLHAFIWTFINTLGIGHVLSDRRLCWDTFDRRSFKKAGCSTDLHLVAA
jgi:hypothetical protein